MNEQATTLKAYAPGYGAVIIQDENKPHAKFESVAGKSGQKWADELARRWNAMPKLLQSCAAALEHMNCLSVANTAAPRPFCDCCVCETANQLRREMDNATSLHAVN